MRIIYLFVVIFLLLSLSVEAHTASDSLSIKKSDSLEKLYRQLYKSKQYDEAFEEINHLIRLRGQIAKDTNWLEAIYLKAEMARKVRDLDNALELLREVRDQIEQMPASAYKATYYNREGAILYEMMRYDEAIAATQKSLSIDSLLRVTSWRQSSNLNIQGAIYRDLGNQPAAQKVLRKAAAYARNQEDTVGYTESLYNLIYSLERSGDFDSVIVYVHHIMDFEKFFNKERTRFRALRHLSTAYYKLGFNQKAYVYLDSAYREAEKHRVRIIKDRANVFEVKRRLEEEQLETQLLEKQAYHQKLIAYLLIALLIFLGVLIVLAYRQRSIFKKLSESERTRNENLSKSLAFRNKLIGIIAHDVRNPIANLIGILRLFRAGGLSQSEVSELMTELEEASNKTRDLLENILSWIKSQNEDLKPNYVQLDLKDYILSILKEVQPLLTSKSIKVNTSIEDVKVKVDADFLGIILRNLLTNAIKYSYAGGVISVSAKKTKGSFVIRIRDEGVGMSKEKISNILNGKVDSNKGTQSEKGTGLGLSFVKELIGGHHGKLDFESKEGKGTTAIVTIPQ